MDKKKQLWTICHVRMKELGVDDGAHRKRLKNEFIEIDVQDRYDYFLNYYENGTRWAKNDHNLLVPFLLGLCPNFDLGRESDFTVGEYPDIDVDYLDVVREYLMNEWAPERFGADRVCHIGTYSTYNLKQSLIDMARIFGRDRGEVLNVTKQFGAKDDEGDALTWDRAITLYPAFREYIKRHPDVADAAQKLCGRNRNMGQHAGGFIVSRVPLSGFVPLVRNKKDNQLTTAWTEGQSAQDLQEVGFIKMDLLSSKMSEQIVDCIGLIRKRHGIEKICAVEGGPNWSDDSYLDDPEALAMANKGDLRFVFQFDSDGMRRLVKQGGVTRFQDLEAYSALYRPGTLSTRMHERYCRRKKGQEEYDIHPLLRPYLEKTYGVMVFQETVMQILNKGGGIPLRDCIAVIKAISKKKIKRFAKHRVQFIINSQVILGLTEEQAKKFWDQIEAFAGYGFNKAHSCVYSHVSARQLWLKCHYPLEYYCSYLNHIRGSDEKLRDCSRDAAKHNVKVNPVDINKSEELFSIADDGEIYYGLSNIKHIGESVARNIVVERHKRPFVDLKDFLERCGTEAKPIQALLSLGAFEGDPAQSYQYYEYYKNFARKTNDRRKRFQVSMASYEEQIREVIGDSEFELIDEDGITALVDKAIDAEQKKKLRRLRGNYRRSIRSFLNNEAVNQKGPAALGDFVPPEKLGIKDDLLTILRDRTAAEMQFYGFTWTNPLVACNDLEDLTFAAYRNGSLALGPVEGAIQAVKEVTSRKGHKYRLVELVDANWEVGYINVWPNDFVELRDKLQEGNIVRMRLEAPNPKFAAERYSLESYPPYEKRRISPDLLASRVLVLWSPDDKLPSNDVTVTLDRVKSKSNDRGEDVERPQYTEICKEIEALLRG